MDGTTAEQILATPAQTPAPEVNYEACDQCGAPVEDRQRYCVVCGTRRRHANDPAARFLADATSRTRSSRRSSPATPARGRRTFGLGTAVMLAVIPLAVAVGVMAGGSAGGGDANLLAALRSQKPTVVNVASAGGAAGVGTAAASTSPGSTPVATLSSTFTLTRGYAVELQTLPKAGSTLADVSAAEHAASAKGASAVGVITPASFHVTPSPPSGAVVIYSGQYKSKATATAALAKLKRKFPSARVIAVQATAGPASSTAVVAHSAYGNAHQVVGFQPSASQLAQGSQIANKTAKQINGNYVKSQQGLPDSVSVP